MKILNILILTLLFSCSKNHSIYENDLLQEIRKAQTFQDYDKIKGRLGQVFHFQNDNWIIFIVKPDRNGEHICLTVNSRPTFLLSCINNHHE